MNDDTPNTRAEAREAGILPELPEFPEMLPYAELEYVHEPQILPLWARRVFYVVGTLAGAGALIVGGYDPELAKNIAGAGAILVASLALANPSR